MGAKVSVGEAVPKINDDKIRGGGHRGIGASRAEYTFFFWWEDRGRGR